MTDLIECNEFCDKLSAGSDMKRLYSLRCFDLDLVTPVAKSVRLNGKATCIRLEVIYWRILEQTAECGGVPVNRLLAQLDREAQEVYGGVGNFSSLVRGVAVTTMARAAGMKL